MSLDKLAEASDFSVARTSAARGPERTAITDDFPCPRCGYNLRGLTERRCPECGKEFDLARLTASVIPWVHRNRIGRFRAYGQTVWLVTFHNERFCQEFTRPVSYADSQGFRWVTVLVAYLCSLPLTLVKTLPDIWLTVASQSAVLLSLVAATGVPSYFFHPRSVPIERQNRGVAMSYYACGHLAWTPLILALGWIVYNAIRSPAAFAAVTGSMMLVLLLAWWRCLVLMARRAMRPGPAAMILVSVVMPIVWVLAAGITYVGVTATICCLGLMYYSLQG